MTYRNQKTDTFCTLNKALSEKLQIFYLGSDPL